jgi:hypothetical protein
VHRFDQQPPHLTSQICYPVPHSPNPGRNHPRTCAAQAAAVPEVFQKWKRKALDLQQSTIDHFAEDVLPSEGYAPPNAFIPSPAMLGVWQGVAAGTGSKTVRDGAKLPVIRSENGSTLRSRESLYGPPKQRAMSLIGATPGLAKVGNAEANPTLRGNARKDDARLADRRADQMFAVREHEGALPASHILGPKQVTLEFVGLFVDPHEHRWADNRRAVRALVRNLEQLQLWLHNKHVQNKVPASMIETLGG